MATRIAEVPRMGTHKRTRKRRPNHRLVKIHRSYTVAEAAKLLGVQRSAIRRWAESGLQTIDDGRPIMVHGSELRRFLESRLLARRRPCQPWEFYCLKCREPRIPDGKFAEYQAITAALGNLFGYCPDCETGMNRRVSPAKLSIVLEHIEVQPRPAETRISDTTQPSLNSHFNSGARGNAEIPSEKRANQA